MPLALSAELVEKLHQLRARQLASKSAQFDKFLLSEELVLLDPGMGPATYLSLDGRIFIDTSDWCGPDPSKMEETNDLEEIVGALLIGSRKQQLPELLELLPTAPAGSTPCELCEGSRLWYLPGGDESQHKSICIKCRGFGWSNTAPEDDVY